MSAINHEILAERKEELEEFFGELIDTYLNDAANLIARVMQAVSDDDSNELREAAHAIKSSSGFMGAERVVELAGSLEASGRSGNAASVASEAEELQTALSLACDELKREKSPA